MRQGFSKAILLSGRDRQGLHLTRLKAGFSLRSRPQG